MNGERDKLKGKIPHDQVRNIWAGFTRFVISAPQTHNTQGEIWNVVLEFKL